MPRESVPRRRVQSDVYLILLVCSLLPMILGSILIYKRLYISYDFNKDPPQRAKELGQRRERAAAVAGGVRPSPGPAEFEEEPGATGVPGAPGAAPPGAAGVGPLPPPPPASAGPAAPPVAPPVEPPAGPVPDVPSGEVG